MRKKPMNTNEWAKGFHKLVKKHVNEILTHANFKVEKISFSIGYAAGILNAENFRELANEEKVTIDEDSFQLGFVFGKTRRGKIQISYLGHKRP